MSPELEEFLRRLMEERKEQEAVAKYKKALKDKAIACLKIAVDIAAILGGIMGAVAYFRG